MSTAHHINDDHARLSAIHESLKDKASPASLARAPGTAPSIVKMHSFGQREIRLSKDNLEHGNISLFSMRDFFSPEVVGGWDDNNAAAKMLTVIFDGQAFETDIDGSQWTLRDRSTLVDLLALFGAGVGDDLIIERIANYVYAFRVKSQAAISPAMPI